MPSNGCRTEVHRQVKDIAEAKHSINSRGSSDGRQTKSADKVKTTSKTTSKRSIASTQKGRRTAAEAKHSINSRRSSNGRRTKSADKPKTTSKRSLSSTQKGCRTAAEPKSNDMVLVVGKIAPDGSPCRPRETSSVPRQEIYESR